MEENVQSSQEKDRNQIKEAALKQLEFYFSDANLSKDRWMSQKRKDNPEGYISLQEIAQFNKMKTITTDLELIKEVLSGSKLIEMNEDKTMIRRAVPVDVTTLNTDAKTVYTENIPLDSTHDSLKELFNAAGNVTYISIPKYEDKSIKGFAFIEYATEDEAKNAVNQLNKYDIEKAPKELRVMDKIEWLRLRDLYVKLLEDQKSRVKYHPHNPDKKHAQHKKNDNRPAKGNNKKESKETHHNAQDNAHEMDVVPEVEYREGVIVRINNIKAGVTKKQLKEAIEDAFPVAYIDYTNDTSQAYIRCNLPDEAKELERRQSNYKPQLGDEVKMAIVKDEEEKIYWSKIKSTKSQKGSTRGRGGNRGARGGGRGGAANRGTEPPQKKHKFLDAPPESHHVKFSDEGNNDNSSDAQTVDKPADQ